MCSAQAGLVDAHADRIDEERHVVGDDLDDRARRVGTAFAGRVEHTHLRATRTALAQEFERALHGRGPVRRVVRGEILGGQTPQEFRREGLRIAQPRTAELGRELGQDRVDVGLRGRAGRGSLGVHRGRLGGGTAGREGYPFATAGIQLQTSSNQDTSAH